MKSNKVYLSRRNLQVLLSKLDRKAKGEDTQCTIIKYDTEHPVFPQTIKRIEVIAVEDSAYYLDRDPGEMHSSDIK